MGPPNPYLVLLVHTLPFVVGLILAVALRHRHPVASLLAALGCGIGTFATSLPYVGNLIWPFRHPIAGAWREEHVLLLLYPVAVALIVAAVFVGRTCVRPRPPQEPFDDTSAKAPRREGAGIQTQVPAAPYATAARREP